MRKKILSLAMLTLLIISVFSVLNIVDISADPSPVIEFAPNEITSGAIGFDFVWSISTDYAGDDIWGYEFSLTYNPVVLEVLNVTNGGVVANNSITSARFTSGTIDNVAGELSVTSAYFKFISPPPDTTSVDGAVLANIGFNVTGNGDSDITFGVGTKLIGWNASAVDTYNIIDVTSPVGSIVDGYFRNMIPTHNVKIAAVSANESSVYSGEEVNVTVKAENTGNVKEEFDVTAYYSTTVAIGTQTITVLGGQSKNVSFIWDTTIARFDLPISAEASDVGSSKFPETSTADNTFVDGTVTVRPPILAVTNSTGGNEIIDITMRGGDTFVVNITITDAYDLSETIFNVTWNPVILTALSIVEGDFLDEAATFTASSKDQYDGKYNMTMTRVLINYSHSVGVTGNGTLATITFEIQTRGGSVIELRPHPTWWTTYWATTPVVIQGVHSNKYDMDFHPPGNYRWIFDIYTVQDWAYPTWWSLYRITVNPINNGFLHMLYNLTIYINETIAETRMLTLVGKMHSPDNKATYTFDWNITGLSWGVYYINACITEQDPDLDDNPNNDYYAFGTPTTIRIPGDTNGDGAVDSGDFYNFQGKYGYDTDDPGFDRFADIDGDGVVGSGDFYVFQGKYGATSGGAYPPP